MVVPARNLSALTKSVKIVDEDGSPSIYFLRYIQERSGGITELDTAVAAVNAAVDAIEAISIASADGSVVITNPSLGDGINPDLSVDEQVVLDAVGTTRGSILYRGASGWALLNPDTSGYVLTDGGAGADPAWAAATGGGGGGDGAYTAYNVATAGDAFINIDLSTSSSTTFHIIVTGTIGPSNATLAVRVSDDGGATFKSGASDYKDQTSNSTDRMRLNSTVGGTGRGFAAAFVIDGINPATTARFTSTGTCSGSNSAGTGFSNTVLGYSNALGTTLQVDALQILCDAGDLDDITVWVKGLGSGTDTVTTATYSPSAASTVDIAIPAGTARTDIDFYFTVSSDGAAISWRVTDDGFSTVKSGASDYYHSSMQSVGTTMTVTSTSGGTEIPLANSVGNAAGEYTAGNAEVVLPSASNTFTNISTTLSRRTTNGQVGGARIAGAYITAAAINGVRIFTSAGTLTGEVRVRHYAE